MSQKRFVTWRGWPTLAWLAGACTPHAQPPAPADGAPASVTAAPPTPSVAARASSTSSVPSAPSSERLPPEPHFDPPPECAALASKPVPAADEPSAKEAKRLGHCDSEALYYGIGRARDFEQARHCAYAQRRSKDGEVFGGSAILMMIYANGKGVPRNIDLASKFACEIESAPLELEGRIARLADLRRAGEGADFDLCDDSTSGFMGGHCAGHVERIQTLKRDARKQAARRLLPAPELVRLERAAKAYFDSREKKEVDLSGTLRAAFMIAERAALEDAFVEALENVRNSDFPPQAGEPAAAAGELDAVYQRIMKCKSLTDSGGVAYTSVLREDVRKTQRLWLSFRDAWIALALKVRPDARRELWVAWLTRERKKALAELAEAC